MEADRNGLATDTRSAYFSFRRGFAEIGPISAIGGGAARTPISPGDPGRRTRSGWIVDLAANESVIVQAHHLRLIRCGLQGGVWDDGSPQAVMLGGSGVDVAIAADGRAADMFRFRDTTSREALSTVPLSNAPNRRARVGIKPNC
jgi:hypothetical protein